MNCLPSHHSVQDAHHPARREALSRLPMADAAALRRQLAALVDQGLRPVVEHVEPEHVYGPTWSAWRLPDTAESNVEQLLDEVRACRAVHPHDHVRLVGYDRRTRSRGAPMMVYRAAGR